MPHAARPCGASIERSGDPPGGLEESRYAHNALGTTEVNKTETHVRSSSDANTRILNEAAQYINGRGIITSPKEIITKLRDALQAALWNVYWPPPGPRLTDDAVLEAIQELKDEVQGLKAGG